MVEGQVEFLQFVKTMEEKTGQMGQAVPPQLQRFQFVQRVENASVQSADLIVVSNSLVRLASELKVCTSKVNQ